MTHTVAIKLHLVAESCIICSPRSRRRVRKLLDTPSYLCMNVCVCVCVYVCTYVRTYTFFCVVLSCVGTGLKKGRSSVQNPTKMSKRIHSFRS